MKRLDSSSEIAKRMIDWVRHVIIDAQILMDRAGRNMKDRFQICDSANRERGDVPGWVLVVLMTTGLVTAIWTIAAPRLTAILRNSLDSMNGIR